AVAVAVEVLPQRNVGSPADEVARSLGLEPPRFPPQFGEFGVVALPDPLLIQFEVLRHIAALAIQVEEAKSPGMVLRRHLQLIEERRQQRIMRLVVNDESRVEPERSITLSHLDGVGMPTQFRTGFKNCYLGAV